MNSLDFALSMRARVADYCESLGPRMPAYSYMSLSNDAQRIKVMQCRLFNELRAAEIFAGWANTTPEPDVKSHMLESADEERAHKHLLVNALEAKGVDPFGYSPISSQSSMLNTLEALPTTVERLAGFGLAIEGVAGFLMRRMLDDPDVPDWVRGPYGAIFAEEEGHGEYPIRVLEKYAKGEAEQLAVERAVSMSLDLRRSFFAGVDRWVYEDEA